MRERRFPPIFVSIILLIIGISVFFVMYSHWDSEGVSISNPIINKVTINSGQLDLKTIIHEAEKNVVQIEGQNEYNTITGSGFLYNEKGDIITNAHVIKDADVINIRTADAQIYPAAVVGIGEDLDIAVIRVPQLAGQSFSTVEKESLAEIGDEIIALGSPHGFQNTVTLGIISGTERNFSVDGFDYSNVYQISAQITHGNSGGPLINRETGKVIGINSVGTEDGTIGFSIPINEVIDQIEQWSNEAQNDKLDFASTSDIITHDPEQFIQEAEYLIDYFLESIDIRDYVNAYALLGSSTQSEIAYPKFREQYINIVDMNYSELSSKITEDNHINTTVNVTIENKLQNEEETSKKTYKFDFTTGYENDQLKILNVNSSES
ncbi:serine protease [Virgibacillus profundi]|uniref:Serine protease n=1 Tax=Virgibacillus profundi TaxID=2024555 RepID=A0A2A2IBM8_9BACI|nr:trypsin-like peptidase domain-containing protein [Virgibacillus profundi]PAV28788.1 serine protease [Virgibacillus profundi]PXY52956.1 serine protease [Virgibacillus profundi]